MASLMPGRRLCELPPDTAATPRREACVRRYSSAAAVHAGSVPADSARLNREQEKGRTCGLPFCAWREVLLPPAGAPRPFRRLQNFRTCPVDGAAPYDMMGGREIGGMSNDGI